MDNIENCCSYYQQTGNNTEIKIDDIKLDVNPNPFTNTCTVTAKLTKGKLKLTSVEGVQIKEYPMSGTSTLELNGEVLHGISGTFMVSLISDDGKYIVKKVTFVK